jgi:uncharacterized membrane protein
MTAGAPRRGYLDWLRGIAVLIMIETHLLDSWTRAPDRETRAFAYAMILGGLGAPLFLFLAGAAVPLSAGSKFRRTGSVRTAAGAVARRGLGIFGLAFLFRVQSWLVSWGPNRTLLKVDILNIMGPSIALAAGLWALAGTARARLAIFAGATLLVAFLTPLIRSLPVLSALPDPIEAYIRPVAGLSNFVFLPWAGFVLAGAVIGVVLDASQRKEEERRANIAFGLAGLILALGTYRASFLPAWAGPSYFWTTSSSFFLMRVGILTAAVAIAWLWASRPGADQRWSPLRQLGRSSLFIYWIHVEMVYGLVSLGLHKRLSWGQSWLALACFSFFMLICAILKDRVVRWWGATRSSSQPRCPRPAVPE